MHLTIATHNIHDILVPPNIGEGVGGCISLSGVWEVYGGGDDLEKLSSANQDPEATAQWCISGIRCWLPHATPEMMSLRLSYNSYEWG